MRNFYHNLPLDRGARPVVLGLLLVFIVSFVFSIAWYWVPALILMILFGGFFRDPKRHIPRTPGAVVSPADGAVVSIFTNTNPELGPVGGPCVAIFLSVFNVHINRAPYGGVVEQTRYTWGQCRDARDPDCGKTNEANAIHINTGRFQMTVRQITGAIARRIVCRVREGQTVKKGERIGLIRFGSRTELYLPAEARLQVEVGQKVKGGSSILAYLPEE